MNVFEIIPNVLVIEDSCDVNFANKILNGSQRVEIGTVVDLKKNNTYVVKPLDTIKTVALKLGLKEQEIKQLAKANKLFIGQKIEY